jgi:hypothetical protein
MTDEIREQKQKLRSHSTDVRLQITKKGFQLQTSEENVT